MSSFEVITYITIFSLFFGWLGRLLTHRKDRR